MKPFWQSKTLIVNALALIGALAAGFGLDLGLDAAVQGQIAGGIMAIVNIVLRFVTSTSIKSG